MIESGRIDVDELKLQLDHDDNEDILHDLNPSLAIERLYERRGKMFGVLVCKVSFGRQAYAWLTESLPSGSPCRTMLPSLSSTRKALC